MKESAFQKKVLTYLKGRGGYWIKIHVGAYQLEGEPDIIGTYKGRFVAFEIKQGAYKATPLQLYKIEQIKKSGGLAMVVYTLDQVVEVLDKIDLWAERVDDLI